MGKQFGDHWTTKVGLRGEQTLSLGQWQSVDSTSRRSYFNLFPNAFVGYMPTEDWSISLDYARRIQRPPYDMLDPTPSYDDAHSTRVGNPNLLPAFTHNLLFSVGYSEYASLDYTFSHTTDWIDYRTTIHTDGTRVSQALNYGTRTSHGIHLSLTEIPIVPRLDSPDAQGRRPLKGAWLALTAQVGASHDTFRSYDNLLHMAHWMVDVYAEMNAYLPREWTVSVDAFYCTPSVWGTERVSAWYEMNLALKKDLPKHGLTLTARVNDLLLSSRWISTGLGLPDGYANNFIGYDRAHKVSIGITYRFGTALSNSTPATPDNAETDPRLHTNARKRK